MYHSLFILSIPERPLSEQSLVHFPSGYIPVSDAYDLGGWWFSFQEKEKKTSMNSTDLVSLIVLYCLEVKSLITIYTKAFSTAWAENYTVSCCHIPALLHCQELESALELIEMKLAVFTSACMKDSREVRRPCSGLASRKLCLHCWDTKTSSETV